MPKKPKIKFYTSLKPEFSCAIATFNIEGWDAAELSNELFNKRKIHTTTSIHEGVSGVRISPNVYTNLQDLDRLVDCISELIEQGPPVKKKE